MQALLFELQASGQRVGPQVGLPPIEFRREFLAGQGFLRVCVDPCLFVVGLQRGHLRLTRQQIIGVLHLEILELRLRRLQLESGIKRFLFDLRITQLQDDALGRDAGARLQQDAVDSTVGCCRNPSCVFGHEGPRSANLACERPSFHRVEYERVGVDSRRCGVHAGQAQRDSEHHERRRTGKPKTPLAAALHERGVAGNIGHSGQ